MCGRYTLSTGLDELAAFFNADISNDGLWDWQANYNIAPASVVPVLALGGDGRRNIVPMRWGIHPHWRKEMPEGRPLFNARVETAEEKPSFRTPWRRRRALVPANGWYEWDRDSTPKTPYYIHDQDHELTALCGLWDHWRVDEGISLISFSILTCPSTGPAKHIHHRMPVRLPVDQWQNWLEPDIKPERTLLNQKDGEDLSVHEVSKVVNSGRAQGKNLILPTVE